jgi:hemoglobin
MKNIPTLYEWTGDMDTFETLFTTFYAKVLKDELLGDVFKNMSAEHIKHVSHFVAEVFGGPKLYTTENNGSHSKMIATRASERGFMGLSKTGFPPGLNPFSVLGAMRV